MGSRVELYAAIRFDWQRNQMSVRALAEKYSVHRRTVREAIASPVPPPRKSPPRRTLVLDSVREVVDAMLVEDLTAPRKQRHTARRIFDQTLALQEDALRAAGCEKIFTDTASGARTDRPGLNEALTYARTGDTLVVWRLDRLGRSLAHL